MENRVVKELRITPPTCTEDDCNTELEVCGSYRNKFLMECPNCPKLYLTNVSIIDLENYSDESISLELEFFTDNTNEGAKKWRH